MKVDDRRPAATVPPGAAKSFGEVLRRPAGMRGRGPEPRGPQRRAAAGAPAPRAALARGEIRARAADASARTERTLRAAHQTSADGSRERGLSRGEEGLRAGLARALRAQEQGAGFFLGRDGQGPVPAPQGAPPPRAGEAGVWPAQGPGAAAPARAAAHDCTEAIAALVERIELSLKDGRPLLALELPASAGASRVEIERCGPRAIAVRIAAPGGAARGRAQASAAALQKALAERGLRVVSLRVA